MLTSDLMRVQTREGKILPRYLDAKAIKRLEPLADALIATVLRNVGETRETLTSELETIDGRASDRPILLGLRKLLLDRCELSTSEGIEPSALRTALFASAAKQRRSLSAMEAFDRTNVIQTTSESFSIDPCLVEKRLFADLRGYDQLLKFRKVSARALIDRYNVALAQGVLMRASSIRLALLGESPGRARQLFREARFQGLLHRIERVKDPKHPKGSYVIELDGPLSLFSAAQRYGFKLALFLPAILRCKRWRLVAHVLWGKTRRPLAFELGPEKQLVPHAKRITGVAPEIDKFVKKFAALNSHWSIKENGDIVALPGEAICVPDLVFDNEETGEQVYLEAFGFWSRSAVWQRIETIERGFPGRIILAIGKQLRVSKDLLDDSDGGSIYAYNSTMRPKEVLALLDAT